MNRRESRANRLDLGCPIRQWARLSDYAKDYATIGDIMNQMATAFSTPFDSEGGGTP
jgi:hypothetical protein